MFSNNTIPSIPKILKYSYNQPSNQQHNNEQAEFIKERFQCPICLKTFDRNEVVYRHIRVHSVERPYKCSFVNCNKRFSRKDGLKHHEQLHYQKLHKQKEERIKRKNMNENSNSTVTLKKYKLTTNNSMNNYNSNFVNNSNNVVNYSGPSLPKNCQKYKKITYIPKHSYYNTNSDNRNVTNNQKYTFVKNNVYNPKYIKYAKSSSNNYPINENNLLHSPYNKEPSIHDYSPYSSLHHSQEYHKHDKLINQNTDYNYHLHDIPKYDYPKDYHYHFNSNNVDMDPSNNNNRNANSSNHYSEEMMYKKVNDRDDRNPIYNKEYYSYIPNNNYNYDEANYKDISSVTSSHNTLPYYQDNQNTTSSHSNRNRDERHFNSNHENYFTKESQRYSENEYFKNYHDKPVDSIPEKHHEHNRYKNISNKFFDDSYNRCREETNNKPSTHYRRYSTGELLNSHSHERYIHYSKKVTNESNNSNPSYYDNENSDRDTITSTENINEKDYYQNNRNYFSTDSLPLKNDYVDSFKNKKYDDFDQSCSSSSINKTTLSNNESSGHTIVNTSFKKEDYYESENPENHHNTYYNISTKIKLNDQDSEKTEFTMSNSKSEQDLSSTQENDNKEKSLNSISSSNQNIDNNISNIMSINFITHS